MKLIAKGHLQVYFTLDGREYVTPSKLESEIKHELQLRGGTLPFRSFKKSSKWSCWVIKLNCRKTQCVGSRTSSEHWPSSNNNKSWRTRQSLSSTPLCARRSYLWVLFKFSLFTHSTAFIDVSLPLICDVLECITPHISAYLDKVAEEINESLCECSQVTLTELAERFALPQEFLAKVYNIITYFHSFFCLLKRFHRSELQISL